EVIRLQRQHRRGSVMAVRGAGHRRESRDNYIRAKLADDAHDIADNLLAIPDFQRLVHVFGESKVNRAAEELLPAVQSSGGQKLLRANDAQLLAKLGAQKILPAVAARERHVGGAIAPAQREIRDELRIL